MDVLQTVVIGVLVTVGGGALATMVHGLRRELREFRAELRGEIQALRTEMREENRALRSDLTQVALAVGAQPRAGEG